MATVDDRIRLKKEGGRYHHGNLKDALVLAAEKAIAKSGEVDLPLRDVARLAGVSHAAAYRHFDSKSALLAEVAVRGFRALAAAMTAAAQKARSSEARLVEAGVAYVAFAVAQPGAFRVMFHPSLTPVTRFPARARAISDMVAVLTGLVDRGEPDDSATMSLWSLVHGHATLLLGEDLLGPFHVGTAEALSSTRDVLRRHLAGLRGR